MQDDNDKDKIKTEFSDIYTILYEIISKIKGVTYTYTKNEEFLNIRIVSESQLVYWIEIIQRMHICGVTSLQRLLKWLHSMDIAWKNENYYGFCSSLRGLIESCSDTFYTSGKVCYTIADHFATIENALRGEAKSICLSEETENELIHFIFGRKLDKSEKESQPKSHAALHITDYLKSLQSEDVNELYSELCQVSHPSIMSLEPFLFSGEDHPLILHMYNIDKELNQNLLNRFRTTILETLKIAITPPICLLKIINLFNTDIVDALRTDSKVLEFMDSHGYWNIVQDKINKSGSELV